MAWIVGIGIGLLLLFSFPKQMGFLLLGCVLLGVGAFLYIKMADNAAERERSKIRMISRYDAKMCSTDYPIYIETTNGTRKTVERISFSLKGFRPGYSGAVSSSYSLSSDKIIKPGETYGSCWKFDNPSYAPVTSPQSLEWRAEINYVTTR